MIEMDIEIVFINENLRAVAVRDDFEDLLEVGGVCTGNTYDAL